MLHVEFLLHERTAPRINDHTDVFGDRHGTMIVRGGFVVVGSPHARRDDGGAKSAPRGMFDAHGANSY